MVMLQISCPFLFEGVRSDRKFENYCMDLYDITIASVAKFKYKQSGP